MLLMTWRRREPGYQVTCYFLIAKIPALIPEEFIYAWRLSVPAFTYACVEILKLPLLTHGGRETHSGLDTYYFLNLAVGQPSNNMDLSEIEIYLGMMIIFFPFQ